MNLFIHRKYNLNFGYNMGQMFKGNYHLCELRQWNSGVFCMNFCLWSEHVVGLFGTRLHTKVFNNCPNCEAVSKFEKYPPSSRSILAESTSMKLQGISASNIEAPKKGSFKQLCRMYSLVVFMYIQDSDLDPFMLVHCCLLTSAPVITDQLWSLFSKRCDQA